MNNELRINEELRDLLPPLTTEEFSNLEESILQNGLQDNIKYWVDNSTNNAYIVDGHNRYEICKKHNISIENKLTRLENSIYKSKDDVIEYMITYQLGRRNLSEIERFEIVQKYKPFLEKKAKQNNSDAGKGLTTLTKVNVRKEMAQIVGISEGTYAKLDKIYKSDNEEIKQKVKVKEVSINKAYEEVVKPKKAEPKAETTADIDEKLLKLDDEITRIKREKENLFMLRQKAFDDTQNELKCEIEFEEAEGCFGNCLYINFWFVKCENRIKVVNKFFADEYKKPIDITLAELERKIRWAYINSTKNTKQTEKEKNIIIAKFYETREKVLIKIKEIEESEDKKRKEFYENLLNSGADTQINPLEKEIIIAGFRQLAKKYHPDNNHGDKSCEEKMKQLNEAKEQLMKKIVGI